MKLLRTPFRIALAAGMLLIGSNFAKAQNPLLATGICNTGLTAKSPQPEGCLSSTLISPINPVGGGPIVDGNWAVAEPFPSASYVSAAPDPCTLAATYAAVPVSAAESFWYNPSDGLSQWIEPLGGSKPEPGWYVYRTRVAIPSAYPGYPSFELVVKGQFMADNNAVAIVLENPAGDVAKCRVVADFTSANQYQGWNNFEIATPVEPYSLAYLYFVVFNTAGNPVATNPTGLRVEFTTPYLYPY